MSQKLKQDLTSLNNEINQQHFGPGFPASFIAEILHMKSIKSLLLIAFIGISAALEAHEVGRSAATRAFVATTVGAQFLGCMSMLPSVAPLARADCIIGGIGSFGIAFYSAAEANLYISDFRIPQMLLLGAASYLGDHNRIFSVIPRAILVFGSMYIAKKRAEPKWGSRSIAKLFGGIALWGLSREIAPPIAQFFGFTPLWTSGCIGAIGALLAADSISA